MRAAGETSITLNVNVNNPRAAALYRRLGFIGVGRRARYQAPASPVALSYGEPCHAIRVGGELR
jgi:ribosomal protein S18 acetylase RimI-like enzyme